MTIYKLAVLDDYAQIAPKHLSQFTSSAAAAAGSRTDEERMLKIDYFPTTLNPSSPSDLKTLIHRLKPYDLISTMRERTPFRENLVESLPNLKVLFTTGMRNLGIDIEFCTRRGIKVVGTRGKVVVPGFDSTNEQTWALILGIVRNVAFLDGFVKSGFTGLKVGGGGGGGDGDGEIEEKENNAAWQVPGVTSIGIAGQTLACMGLGRLGLQCARTGKLGFGMNVIAWSPNLTQQKADEDGIKIGLPEGSVRVVASKEDLLRQADILSVHLVLSERSRGIIGKQELELMKRSAMLINTSRGPLIDERALLDVLRVGQIRGYAADVFDIEPLPADSEWRSTDWGTNGKSHVLISPHMGYVDQRTLNGMYEETAKNIAQWLNGETFTNEIK